MKTQTHHSQTQPDAVSPVEDRDYETADDNDETEVSERPVVSLDDPAPPPDPAPTADDNDDPRAWRSMESAPKDFPIEGRLSEEQDTGIMMRWRTSRHRVGHTWEIGGVWHDATTPGAVQVRPIAWRPWLPVTLHFETPQEPDAA